nr:uncharacterized protein LOC113689719 isoform X3 [Coffea arabica]
MAATSVASAALRRALHSLEFLPPRAIGFKDKFYYSRPLPFATPLHSSSALGLCQLSQAIKSDTDFLLKGVGDKDTNEDVKRVLEMAERCRLSVGHPEVLTSDPDIVAALSVLGNFGFQPCSHGDFLGAILGTGITRDKLGDIILQGEKGAYILVVPELADYLTSSLDKVGNVSVTCKKIPLLAIEYEPPRTKAFKTVESSLRLDAISSAGYKISRTKMAALISNGDVRVNWTGVLKSNTNVKTGDIISVSGRGRLKIGEINSTKKGKFVVELIRYM